MPPQIRGRKKWIMYPPGVVPPGVQASEDGATVATPLSLMEWFSKFYEHTRTGPVKPLEVSPGTDGFQVA